MASKKQRNEDRKRSGSETRKRGPIIGFRVTEDERAKVQAAADRVGLTTSSYARSRALEKPTTRAVRRPPVQTAQFAQLLGLLGTCGGELQRISQRLDADQSIAATEMTLALFGFREAASAIMQLLGKRPHDY
jgi:hypothetical protein